MRHAGIAGLLILVLLAGGQVLAAPIVSSTSSTSLAEGSVVTIRGSDFGTKPQAAPMKWDDFDAGVSGDVVTGWYTESHVPGYKPRYSTARVRVPGRKSCWHEFFPDVDGPDQYNSTLGLTSLDIQRIYISGWFYNETSGGLSRNVKPIALRGGSPGMWGLPNGRMDLYPTNGGGQIYVADCNDTKTAGSWGLRGDLYSGAWHRMEVWFDIGTTSGGGLYTVWRDLAVWATTSGTFINSADCRLTNAYFMPYFATDENSAAMNWYWDELYVDVTRARVEIGNASTWAACTQREIQIPQTWSTGEISVRLNKGTLPSSQTLYMYVVDGTGAVNPQGYPVSFGGSVQDPGPPGAPGQPHL